MLSRYICILMLAFWISPAQAKNEVVILGGGGDPPGDTTIFDQAYKSMGLSKPGSGWSFQSFYDGGHSQSEAIAAEVSGGTNKPFTTANANAAIDSLKQRIISGDLKSGDQLLINIFTHGAQPKSSEATHSVATTDGEFSIDKIKELRDLAEEKGVRLGIVDMSCYSGASLDLGTDKTCVVTAANDNVGYSNTGSEAAANMRAGRDLEGVFLFARQAPNMAAPQISTDAGRRAYEETRFLTDITMRGRSVDDVLGPSQAICSPESDFSRQFKIAAQIKDIEREQRSDLLAPLEEALRIYEQARLDAQSLTSHEGKKNSEICQGSGGKPVCMSLAEWHGELNKRRYEKPLLPAQERRVALANEVTQRPEYQRWLAAKEEREGKNQTVVMAAKKVAAEERKVYDALYKKYSAESTAPNPCKDFKL